MTVRQQVLYLNKNTSGLTVADADDDGNWHAVWEYEVLNGQILWLNPNNVIRVQGYDDGTSPTEIPDTSLFRIVARDVDDYLRKTILEIDYGGLPAYSVVDKLQVQRLQNEVVLIPTNKVALEFSGSSASSGATVLVDESHASSVFSLECMKLMNINIDTALTLFKDKVLG